MKFAKLIFASFLISGLMSCGGNGGSKEQGGNIKPPEPTVIVDSVQDDPFNVNLYIENSGSMDGYVSGGSDFKNSIHSYLADIKSSHIAKAFNLFYVNNRIISRGSDIEAFFRNMSPASFKREGGDRKATDISKLLKTIIENTKSDDVSLIVSDFIFSPGKQDAQKYLEQQEIEIKSVFSDYVFRNPDIGVMLLQLTSNFSGTYYNRTDAKIQLKDAERPFYILMLGNKKYLRQIRTSVPESDIKGSGIRNIYVLERQFDKPRYAIQMSSGDFSLDRKDSKKSINNAKKGRDGYFRFAVNVDFSKILIPEDYVSDAGNYVMSDRDFALTIGKAPSNNHGYTHSLKLSSQRVKPVTLKIRLRKSIPDWIDEYNDSEGIDINKGNASRQTYGLVHIVNGISSAFGKDDYTEITININKN